MWSQISSLYSGKKEKQPAEEGEIYVKTNDVELGNTVGRESQEVIGSF